jgi:hypothetical protein
VSDRGKGRKFEHEIRHILKAHGYRFQLSCESWPGSNRVRGKGVGECLSKWFDCCQLLALLQFHGLVSFFVSNGAIQSSTS